jgi:hypothetical protein
MGDLHDAVGSAVLQAAEVVTDPDPDGWPRYRLNLDWPDEAALILLRAGRWVEVLEPADIRAGVAATARAIADRYPSDLV